jgi:FkbM family methyltransferase
MLADVVGPHGHIVAVEPNPHNAAQCLRNRELNAKPWVEVVQAAVAAEEGTILLNGGLNAQVAAVGEYGGVIEVPAVTIDTLAARFGIPDVLFIDVEGFEVQALRGAHRTLSVQPDCFVEVHIGCGLEQAGGCIGDIVGYFPTTRYELWACSESDATMHPFPEIPPDHLRSRIFLLALKRAHAGMG